MMHQDKVASFEQLLRERGYWLSNAIPPAYRFMWLLGIETPPPYFLSFPVGFLTAGTMFGIFWGVFMWFFAWSGRMPVQAAVGLSLLAGGLFGLFMATFWRYQAKKLGLSTWEAFPPLVER